MQINAHHRPHLEKVIKRFHSSFFFYDLDGLNQHLQDLSSTLGHNQNAGVKLWYACKANPLSAILKVIRNNGFGVDVASKGELEHALASGVKPESILSTGPAKSTQYLQKLLEEDVSIVVCESINQVRWLNELAKTLNKRPIALLRVQLDWSEGSSVLGGNSITPFGEDIQSWQTLKEQDFSHIQLQGLHVFQWGNILELSQLKKIWWSIATRSKELAETLEISLKILDLGGGIGIPYTHTEKAIDPKEVGELLNQLKAEFDIPEIWMELGRYVTGPFGSYFTQVIDRKNVRGQDILVLDGGINHIARPALTHQSFPVERLRPSSKADPTLSFQIHGPLCTAIDKLGEHPLPKDTAPGDWLAFHQAGAYGFTEGLSFFLCHNLPAEVILYEGNLMIPRTPKTPVDWLV